jgi:uncharacterized protein (TIGR03382 family)
MSEVGSLWCSAHRARCSKPNTKNDAGEFQPGPGALAVLPSLLVVIAMRRRRA